MWVIDASIAVKWFFTDAPNRNLALDVREHLLLNPDDFVVPILFYSEILHVLSRKSGKDSLFVKSSLELLLRLGIRSLPLSAAGWVYAVEFSCAGLSGYDATYLALAHEQKAFWLTADEKAAQKVKTPHFLSLADWKSLK